MTTVLVTGADGFLGVPTVAALNKAGLAVHAVSRRPRVSTRDVTWHAVDLLNDAAVERLCRSLHATHVLHLAWTTQHGRFWHSRDNLAWTAATLRLFQAFAAAGGTRFVGVGSAAEYGEQVGACHEERSPMQPNSLYGVAKHTTQSVLAAASADGETEFAWARVFQPFGPGEHADRLVPSISAALLSGRPTACTNGSHVRDFVHVHDVGRALAALVQSGMTGAVNIGTGRGTPVATVAALLGDLAGRPDLVRLDDDQSGEVRAAVRDHPPAGPSVLVADVGRLTIDLGFRPQFDLESGLSDAFDWWRAKAAS